jgi:hypothetical protein
MSQFQLHARTRTHKHTVLLLGLPIISRLLRQRIITFGGNGTIKIEEGAIVDGSRRCEFSGLHNNTANTHLRIYTAREHTHSFSCCKYYTTWKINKYVLVYRKLKHWKQPFYKTFFFCTGLRKAVASMQNVILKTAARYTCCPKI